MGTVKPLAHRSIFLPVLSGMIVVAWVTLVVWDRSPYGRYLKHEQLGAIASGAGCAPIITQALLYVLGWSLMTAAMMLPTTLPLLEIFQRLTRQRVDHGWLLAQVIGGYLLVWLGFGIAVHFFDLGLHRLFEASACLQDN